MRQSEENIRKIEDAAISGKYQIVCRQVLGSLNSWYITNNPTTEWNWGFNEYRIYVGCNEPPMTNKMNDYSVYYCGYNYYFLEGGTVKKQVNVNVAQDCESAPYFKSNHILSDKITPLENGNVEIENLRADGLKANEIFTDKVTSLKGDTVSIGQNLTVEGNLTVKGDTKQVNTVLETLNYKRIEVNSTGEVSLSSADTDSILVGAKTSTNLGIDANEIQARNNGSASTLYLNPQGGNVEIKSLVVKGDSTIPGYATTTEVNAKYTKPSTGIPKTDLASDVQTSLGKADTALQSHQDISGKADKKDIPTKTSQLTNDSNFITSSSIPTDVVKYSTQTLTDTQKAQARKNIGAGASSFSGDYNDLTNKPTIPTDVVKNSELLDLIYPVGSIYMSVNTVSPTTFIGGKWERIKDTFLLSAGDTYNAGSTGGEATHKLTEDEMPSHSHTTNGQSDEESGSMNGHATGSVTSSWEGLFNGRGDFTTTGNMSVSGSTSWAGGDNSTSNRPTTLSIDVSHTHDILHTHTTETKGKSSAHNNMPPYLAVYCWKRVS